ncbi:hypothetical protein [Bradyrhizobium sp. RDM4]|uniref:hypothetical protein n=1 Tax=Bradyrhizobium sp. RDM4 TaxID=3378765 RepID=UPI0038FC7E16
MADRMMEYFQRLQRSHGEKVFHISHVRHACDKDNQGGDYWGQENDHRQVGR